MTGSMFTSGFIPHGHCYLWDPTIVWMQVLSNGVIAASYVCIATMLCYLVYRLRAAIPYRGMFLAFGAFIVLCGITHMFDVLVIWRPAYWADSAIRIVTAIASAATAIMLVPRVPHAVALLRAGREAEERGVKLETAVRELGALYQRAREHEQMKSRFFANVSHELRTPITLVLGPIQKLLADGHLDERARDELHVALRNGRLLQNEVDELLLASKIEGGMQLEYAELDLAQLLRTVVSNFDSIAEDRHIRCEVIAPAFAKAQGDPEKVQRIVLNLLSNAFKFTPDGGRIRCELASDGEPDSAPRRFAITVADSGPGIEPQDRARVFERYYQIEGVATQRSPAGFGLGLAIVKELVELHGGSVGVTQAPEGGAAFVVTLPVRAPAGARVRSAAAEPENGDFEAVKQTIEPLRAPVRIRAQTRVSDGRPRVLIVEDHAELNRFICDCLSDDYEVVPCVGGKEGLARAIDARPDIVITDLMMPVMGGAELIRSLRQHRELDRIPIVVLTALSDETERVRLLGAGASDFLMKPFAVEELRARVRNLVAMKRSQDQLIKARQEAESANKELEAFNYSVSHDLRAPLRAIVGFSEALREDYGQQLNAQAHEYIGLIEQAADRMRALIDALLDLSRLGRGQLSLGAVDLSALARQLCDELRVENPEHRVDVEIQEGLLAQGDIRLLRLALRNLLENAWKYTRDTEGARVQIGASGESERAFFVRDNGPGFDMRQVDRLFAPFARLHRQDQFPGLGIGLATVQRIILRHGGRVWAQADPGHGATFFFTLPTARSVARAALQGVASK